MCCAAGTRAGGGVYYHYQETATTAALIVIHKTNDGNTRSYRIFCVHETKPRALGATLSALDVTAAGSGFISAPVALWIGFYSLWEGEERRVYLPSRYFQRLPYLDCSQMSEQKGLRRKMSFHLSEPERSHSRGDLRPQPAVVSCPLGRLAGCGLRTDSWLFNWRGQRFG